MVKITIIVSSGEQFWGMDLKIRWRTWDEFRAFGQGQVAFSSQPGRELDLCMNRDMRQVQMACRSLLGGKVTLGWS